MTAYELSLRLAKFIGLTSFDPDDDSNTENILAPGVVAGDREFVVSSINGALKEIWELVPSSLRYRRVGAFLRAPVSVTVDLTQYSDAVTISGFESWMVGCSIRLPGDATDNEIRSETKLVRPHLGATAAGVSATVFHDCVTPGDDVAEILGPVEIPQVRKLESAGSRAEFYLYDRGGIGGDDYGHWSNLSATIRNIEQPKAYFVDAEYDPEGGVATRLRVTPLPGQTYPLAFGARINAPSITVEDITLTSPGEGEGEPTDPGTEFPLPAGWAEAVLCPFALRRFTAHPAFGAANPSSVAEIARQCAAAMQMINRFQMNREAATLTPTFR